MEATDKLAWGSIHLCVFISSISIYLFLIFTIYAKIPNLL